MSPSPDHFDSSPFSVGAILSPQDERLLKYLKEEQLKNMKKALIEGMENSELMLKRSQHRYGLGKTEKELYLKKPFIGLLVEKDEDSGKPRIHPVFTGGIGRYFFDFDEYIEGVKSVFQEEHNEQLEHSVGILNGENWSSLGFLFKLREQDYLIFPKEIGNIGRINSLKYVHYQEEIKDIRHTSMFSGDLGLINYDGYVITTKWDDSFEQKVNTTIESVYKVYSEEEGVPIESVADIFREGLSNSGMPMVEGD